MKRNTMKILLSFVCFAIFFSALTIQPLAAEANSILLEDVNKDGVINGEDLIILRTALLTEEASNGYDVTGNGALDTRDVVRMKRVMNTDGLLGVDKADDANDWAPMF